MQASAFWAMVVAARMVSDGRRILCSGYSDGGYTGCDDVSGGGSFVGGSGDGSSR